MGPSTVTAHLRLTVSDFDAREVLLESKVGTLLSNLPVSRRSMELLVPAPLGQIRKFLSILSDGDFQVQLVSGTATMTLVCSKAFIVNASFDSVIVSPVPNTATVSVRLAYV